jgi:hypothetical protein
MNKILKKVRKNIFDHLVAKRIVWHGRLDQVQFLNRMFDLESLPSQDCRFPTASGDIWQHTINNDDFEPDWVFYDDRFDLLNCPDNTLLDFLENMLHPAVRDNIAESTQIQGIINIYLKDCGIQFKKNEIGENLYIFRATQMVSGAKNAFGY